jgi:hypothetical protein
VGETSTSILKIDVHQVEVAVRIAESRGPVDPSGARRRDTAIGTSEGAAPSPAVSAVQHINLPRPWRVARTLIISLAESFGIPLAVFAGVDVLAGDHAALLAGLGCAWLAMAVRRLLGGPIPGLLIISTLLLSLQTVVAFTTGDTWVYLLQPAIAKLLLSGLFVRSTRSRRPLIGQLAKEVCALPETLTGHADLTELFRRLTLLWAGIFAVLAFGMGVMAVTQSVAAFLLTSTSSTVGLILLGAGFSLVWFRRRTRGLGLRMRFSPTL